MTLDEKVSRVYEVLMAGKPEWKWGHVCPAQFGRNPYGLKLSWRRDDGIMDHVAGMAFVPYGMTEIARMPPIYDCLSAWYHSTGKREAFG